MTDFTVVGNGPRITQQAPAAWAVDNRKESL